MTPRPYLHNIFYAHRRVKHYFTVTPHTQLVHCSRLTMSDTVSFHFHQTFISCFQFNVFHITSSDGGRLQLAVVWCPCERSC